METYFIALICAVAGVLAGYMAARRGRQVAVTRAEVLQSRLDDLGRRLEEAGAEAEARCAKVAEEKDRACKEALESRDKYCRDAIDARVKACNEALEAQERRHNEAMKALQARFDETLEKVSAQLKTATEDMFRQRQREFSEASNTNLGQIVNPLRETIDKMKKAMDESTLRQTEIGSAMKATAETMIRQSEAARKSADELSRVFRHESKVQGNWGERVLSDLLEAQGLVQGLHYDVQATVRDASGNVVKPESGSALRPDVILHLDTRREVIIDSKVSLSAYMDYVNSGNEEDRRKFLKAHVESIRKHVKELAAKDYSSYIMPPKVGIDYVIMFVPHSGALWTALNAEPDLWRKSMDQNVFIADEQTLFAALRIINMTWVQIAQAQNHEKVYALAAEMLDRVGQFMKKYDAVGKSLEAALRSYEEAGRKLSPSGQSILQTCAKLQKLGARQSDRNPLPQLSGADADTSEAN